jgi:SAM-dependent methyltransferase
MSDESGITATERARIRAYFGPEGATWTRWRRGRVALVNERRVLLLRVARMVEADRDIPISICDVGCGTGEDLAAWRTLGVPAEHLAGTELTPERAEAARHRVPGAAIHDVDAFELPFGDGSFTLVTASLVLSAIEDEAMRRRLFSEMRRVTAPRGATVVYDMRVRKPWNSRVIAMTPRRVRALGSAPDVSWRVAPLLPVLDFVLRLPSAVRGPIHAILPRTHAMHVWWR